MREGGNWPGTIRAGLSLHRGDFLAALWDGVGGLVLGWDIHFPSLCHPRVLAHPPDHPPLPRAPGAAEQDGDQPSSSPM